MEMKAFVDTFKWESEVQKKGFLSMIKWFRDHGEIQPNTSNDMARLACFFIQRDHESNEWWREFISDQITRLQDQVVKLDPDHKNWEFDKMSTQILSLERRIASLETMIRELQEKVLSEKPF